MLAAPPQERPARLLACEVRGGWGAQARGTRAHRLKPPECLCVVHDGCAVRAARKQESLYRLLWPRHHRRLSARYDRQVEMVAAGRA